MPVRDDLLKPIPGANPGGSDLRYAEVTDKLKEARREDDPTLPHDDVWDKPQKIADWPLVVKLAGDALATKSKDLQIAAWLTEGMLRQDGFGGLKAGLELIHALLEQFWDQLYPLPDGTDLDQRAAPLNWVGTALDGSVRNVALTKAGFGLLRYTESRAVGYEAVATDDKAREARQSAITDGLLTAEEFDKAFDETPKAWYKQLAADINASLVAVKALDTAGGAKFGHAAPSYSRLLAALENVHRVAQQLLEKKLETDPDLADASAPELGVESAGPAQGDTLTAEPTNADDAARRIVGAAHYLRRAQSQNPVPYLVLRALRWGELRARGTEFDPKLLAAPSTQVRTSLRTLALDAKWPELLEAGENVMGTPQGRGWLDVQRHELMACEQLGAGYERVAAAIRGMLVMVLRDFPQLPDATLMDDLPAANSETRSWLRSAGILGAAEEAAAAASAAATTSALTSAPRGAAVDRAMEEVRAGRPQKGIELLMREAGQEKSRRARFLHRSEAAAIMVEAGLEAVALPILTELVEQVQTHKLDEWEPGDVVARPMGLLYRCLQKLGGDEQTKRDLYRQLCQLDPMQAMSIQAPSQSTDGTTGA